MLSYEPVRDEIGLLEKKRNHLLLGWSANHDRIIPGNFERFSIDESDSVKKALIHAVTKTHLNRPAEIATKPTARPYSRSREMSPL